MPPLGTQKFAPIRASGAVGDDAEYHRTFDPFSANKLGMWPEFKQKKNGWNYRGDGFHRDFIEEYAKRVGAFYAYHRIGKGVGKIRVMPKHDQTFWKYATEWEDDYSTLTANWVQRVEPFVDDKLKIAGHIGWWWAREIWIPKSQGPDIDVQKMVNDGVDVFAYEDNPMPSHYHKNYCGNPEWKYRLLTAPDGRVEAVLGTDSADGAKATIAPWEAISIGRAAVTLAAVGLGAGKRYFVAIVMRKGGQRTAAVGPTKALAEGAAKRAAIPESGTLHSVSVGSYGTPGHLVARIEVEEGKVVYRVASVHFKAQGKAVEIKARAAHRDMIQRAAQEAQKRGQNEFTYRGIDAGDQFRAHANKLAGDMGRPGSGKALPNSSGGKPDYEVTLDTAKVLASNQSVAQAARAAGSAQRSADRGRK
jgi:hypothetical protein